MRPRASCVLRVITVIKWGQQRQAVVAQVGISALAEQHLQLQPTQSAQRDTFVQKGPEGQKYVHKKLTNQPNVDRLA